jgi:hypothetical protein
LSFEAPLAIRVLQVEGGGSIERVFWRGRKKKKFEFALRCWVATDAWWSFLQMAEELGFKHGPVEIKGGAMKSEIERRKRETQERRRLVEMCQIRFAM